MTEEEVKKLLKRLGAIITGSHFVYASGRHGPDYIDQDAVSAHPESTALLCRSIAEAFSSDLIETVAGPALGGIALAHGVAGFLSMLRWRRAENFEREVFAVYAEKARDGKTFVVRPGQWRFMDDRNVLIVDDVITTGDSLKSVSRAVREVGGKVLGAGVICNRGRVTKEILELPRLFALASIPLESWSEAECPLCADKVPINTDFGRGREFLMRRQARS